MGRANERPFLDHALTWVVDCEHWQWQFECRWENVHWVRHLCEMRWLAMTSIPFGVCVMCHVTVFRANTAHPMMHKLHGLAVPLKIVYNGSILCIQIVICPTLINYCVEEYIFEFQVFTGVDKAVFRVSLRDQSLRRHVWQCLAWCSY